MAQSVWVSRDRKITRIDEIDEMPEPESSG